MFFLNLSPGEFLALLGGLGGLITTLYLLDRTRRKRVVSTLRFWNPALGAEQQQKRKRVREPLSLVLQLASLLFLLLAIAQLEWGTRERRGHDHVILLDTSAWTAQQMSDETVLDREKAAARQYVTSLPSRDRAMLVRAAALSAPATPFTTDRLQLSRAIRESVSTFSALNIEQALSFARQARDWSGGQPGEIVYIGPKLETDPEPDSAPARLEVDNLRVIPISAERENIGIRSIAVKRSEDEANSWDAAVIVKNYGSQPRPIHLRAQFAGTVFAPRSLLLRGGQETAVQYSFVTDTAGAFTATIDPRDALALDNQATVELPRSGALTIAAFTKRPDVIRPLLAANPQLVARFFSPSEYVTKPAAAIMLLDQFAPAAGMQPKLPSLWIEPPKQGSPLPIMSIVHDAVIKTWQPDALLSTGLHAKETSIPRAEVFQTFEGDEPVASIAEGPIVVARTAQKQAIIGFDPLNGDLRFAVTTPLLVANMLRWLSPEAFRTVDIIAGRVGTASVSLDKGENTANLRVSDERGFAVPFTVRDQTLELFASRPSIVRVTSDEHERVLSLTLPDIAEREWKVSGNISTGVPSIHSFGPSSIDLWRWLALFGGLGLLIEWLLFGRRPVFQMRRATTPAARSSVSETKPELVAK